ncbi:MAG: nuclear transport factor 2 family protein, partial [Planctomycetota bacterium]
MKQIIHLKTFILAIFFILYSCAGIPLKDYQPRSADEEEIIKVIMKHERAWNEHDTAGFMATYHSSALIENGCTGPLLSKSELANEIKQIMEEYPTVKFINPKLDVSGNEAIVKVTSTE